MLRQGLLLRGHIFARSWREQAIRRSCLPLRETAPRADEAVVGHLHIAVLECLVSDDITLVSFGIQLVCPGEPKRAAAPFIQISFSSADSSEPDTSQP